MLLGHGFPDRLPDADAIAYPGVPSPKRLRQPGPSIPPIALQGADGYADHTGCFLHAQAGVVAKLDNLRQFCVLNLELLDRLIQREQITGRRFDPG